MYHQAHNLMAQQFGTVYLVGGGPGDPGLITLRGCQCLARADVVLYDYLVNPQVLVHANPRAELVCLGRHGRDRILPQEEINARLVAHARAGRTVVRLKGGDPIVFARAAEEIGALEQAGVPYEIVPGITAALAVGSYAGIPLTRGDAASAVALVTGHERDDKTTGLDYAALAAFPGTLVFYMGVTTAEHWAGRLIAAGKPADTPAAIVRRCSLADQQTIVCTLGTVADEIRTRRLRPPALVIVGTVATLASGHNWFVERPLFGRRVLVTRAAHQASELASALSDLGADVLVQPAIEIAPPADWAPVDAALARIDEFDWIVFSSANGVRSLLDRLLGERDLRALHQVKLAAIGPGSAEELAPTTCGPTWCPANTGPRRWPPLCAMKRVAASGFCWPGPAADARCWPQSWPRPADGLNRSLSMKVATSISRTKRCAACWTKDASIGLP